MTPTPTAVAGLSGSDLGVGGADGTPLAGSTHSVMRGSGGISLIRQPRIYLAACFEAQERMKKIREVFQNRLGVVITSTWLDEEAVAPWDPHAPGMAAVYQQYAMRDLAEVALSDMLFVDTLDTNTRGGAQVEVGYAVGLGKPVVVVGPCRNVFHFGLQHYDYWEDFFPKGSYDARA